MTRCYPRPTLAVVVLMAIGAVACGEAAPDPLAPSADAALSGRSGSVTRGVEPQPFMPLSLDFSVEADGDSWFGTISVAGQECGSLALEETESRQTGVVTHVAYTLSLVGANTDFRLDADVAGILVRDRAMLNGRVTDGAFAGQTLHPSGQITYVFTPEGPARAILSGSVMLRPQPEPPGRPVEFPPSPCLEGGSTPG